MTCATIETISCHLDSISSRGFEKHIWVLNLITITMKGKIRFYVIVLLSFIATSTTFSQNYATGIGARVGFYNGLTVKHFVNDLNAAEGLLTFHSHGLHITGLYEWQKPVIGVENFDWLIGGGGHIGFENRDYWSRDVYNSYIVIGVDFIIGVEYTFKEAPFTIGIDWKPAINLVGYNHWWGGGIGLTFRYNLNKPNP